jgi:hypothetical protein
MPGSGLSVAFRPTWSGTVAIASPMLPLPHQASPDRWRRLASWQAHELEAWTAAPDAGHAELLHSGGDDAAYRIWDLRLGFNAPAWQDRCGGFSSFH